MASAPVPGGAWLLALAQGERDDTPVHVTHEGELNARLAGLPVFLLRQARPQLELLQGIGVRSLRDLAQLPRAGLARRFGKELLQAFDQALGKQPSHAATSRRRHSFARSWNCWPRSKMPRPFSLPHNG